MEKLVGIKPVDFHSITFLRFSERSEKHRLSGARYAAIAREVEQQFNLSDGSNSPSSEFLDSIRRRLDSLGEAAPSIPPRIWKMAESRHKNE